MQLKDLIIYINPYHYALYKIKKIMFFIKVKIPNQFIIFIIITSMGSTPCSGHVREINGKVSACLNCKKLVQQIEIMNQAFQRQLDKLSMQREKQRKECKEELSRMEKKLQNLIELNRKQEREIKDLEIKLQEKEEGIRELLKNKKIAPQPKMEPKEEARQRGLQQKIIEAAKVKVWSDLEKQQQLRVGFRDLLELPTKLCLLTQLKELKLWENKLKFLPENIGALKELRQLRLYSNQLTKLPQSLGNLRELTRFDLSSNQLTELPQSLRNLTKLEELYLDNNQLSSLPTWIGQLKFLARLSFDRNKITQIPESFQNLKQITVFSFDLHLISEKNIFKAKPISSFTKLNLLWLYYPNADQQRIELIKKECKQREIELYLNGSEQQL